MLHAMTTKNAAQMHLNKEDYIGPHERINLKVEATNNNK
jgi:hypothetical protein